VWELLAAVAAGFVVAALGTPAGVSGAVFLLPVQLSVLGVTGPAVSATNLLFNIVSTPPALIRLARRRASNSGAGRQAVHGKDQPPGTRSAPARENVRLVVAAGVPSAILGAYLRVTVLADPGRFRLLVAALLLPLGGSLLWRAVRRRPERTPSTDPSSGPQRPAPPRRPWALVALSCLAAAAGGVLGIGGGSLLAPALVAIHRYAARDAAVLALAVTLTTSVSGLVSYTVFDLLGIGARPAAPYWIIGLALGIGGVAGGLVGTRLAERLSDRLLTAVLGGVATLTALSYLLRA
jgi:uncharacterized protein